MYLRESKTVVVKIGSSLLIDEDKKIRDKWLINFAKDIQNLQKLKKNIIIVSSGAIALGCKKLKLNKKSLKLDKSQAIASIGQIELMNLFKKYFSVDCLILLSDVNGLYTKNPKIDRNAKLIKEIKSIDENIEKIATKSISEHGTGGMKTKIDAAKICQLSGCHMAIANGLINRPIKNILLKNNCTWFLPKISKLDARKKWIISSISPKGDLIIDDGALNALKKGKSLLAAGIKNVRGNFNKGDHIKILDKNLKEFARGLSSFTSDEISIIKGQHSKIISNLLGYVSKSEVVHKDDMVRI
ncbi:MAG: glutamate 5-kinase [Proteobacteria bacterium]|nr:glutamate 5-kinase [Pseudomonadota bacterium]